MIAASAARRPLVLPGPSAGLRIGLLGGSFDPAHRGHAHLIDVARRRLDLDWVWIIPARGNPLKRTATPFADRLAAAAKTLARPRVRLSTAERDLNLTYTVDLIRALKRRAPTAHFVWLMGADNLAQIERWRRWREIAGLVPIAVIARRTSGAMPGLSRFAQQYRDRRRAVGAARNLADAQPPAWIALPAPLEPSSSTALRREAAKVV